MEKLLVKWPSEAMAENQFNKGTVRFSQHSGIYIVDKTV